MDAGTLTKLAKMKISARLRQPRMDEIKLMRRLASGPCALDSGPVGRCSSRGWIRYIGMGESSDAVYELTASGRAKLEGHATRTSLKSN
jgi:hypothetical protein